MYADVSYFILGAAGAGVYLFLLLLTKGDLQLLRNNVITRVGVMAVLFIGIGGLVTTLYESSTGTAFSNNLIWKVFLIGLGWQGMISGFSVTQSATHKIEASNNALQQQIGRYQELEKSKLELYKEYNRIVQAKTSNK